ncbi:MAG: cell division ATP-binding protein FtsE, partial [Peptococcaceae bacterium]
SWELMKLLMDINRRGTTVIMATHAWDIVNAMKKRVLALTGGRLIRDEERGAYCYEA